MGRVKYAILIMALILLSLTGCSGQSKDDASIKKSGKFTDGTYTETAKGKKGKFDVTVVNIHTHNKNIDMIEKSYYN